MVQPHHTIDSVTPTVTGGLRPYEFIATPAITLVLEVIVDRLMEVGESFAPGVRSLAKWAGLASAGQITPILRQLDEDGWIEYAPDGTITLLRHPDQDADQLGVDETDLSVDRMHDQPVDRADQAIDRTDQRKDRPDTQTAEDRAETRKTTRNETDLRADRFLGRMVHDTHEQQQDRNLRSVVVKRDQVPCAADFDQASDRQSPAAQVMAELGAEPAVIADALLSRPDWTPQQVRDRWSYDQERIAQSAKGDGKLKEGIFFHALRCGQLAPPRANPERPIDPAAYADDDQFRAGGDVSDPEATEESPHERARRLAPDDATGLEFVFLVGQLAGGATDEEALAALQERRAPRRLGGRAR